MYKIGDKVLVRYPFGSRVPYKRHILPGKIVRRSRGYDRFVVKFRNPEGVLVRQWNGVENITSRTLAEEKHRRNVSVDIISNLERKKQHREKYYIVKENTHDSDSVSVYADERNETISNTSSDNKMQSFCRNKDLLVDYDPTELGNCQFSSVSHQLRRVGLNRSASQLRKDAVDHLTRHSEYYQDFVEGNVENYLKSMSSKSTFGDNLTLLALSREHNCQFIVINSRGSSYNQLISISGVYDDELHTFQLGFYPEIHYVSLRIESRAAFERIINGLRNTSRYQRDEQMQCVGSLLRSQREEAISDSPREENLSNVGGFG